MAYHSRIKRTKLLIYAATCLISRALYSVKKTNLKRLKIYVPMIRITEHSLIVGDEGQISSGQGLGMVEGRG